MKRRYIIGGLGLLALLSGSSLYMLKNTQETREKAPETQTYSPFQKGTSIEKRTSHRQKASPDSFQTGTSFSPYRDTSDTDMFAEREEACLDLVTSYYDSVGETPGPQARDFCQYLSYNPEWFGDKKERSCVWDVTQYLRELRESDDPALTIPASKIRQFCRGRTSVDEDALVLSRDIASWHDGKGKAVYESDDGTVYTVSSYENGDNVLDGNDYLYMQVRTPENFVTTLVVDATGIFVQEHKEMIIDNKTVFAPVGEDNGVLSDEDAEKVYHAIADEFGFALVNGKTESPSQ